MQRVSRAQVRAGDELVSQIGPGLLVLLGITQSDDEAAAERLAQRVLALRVFDDAQGRLNEPLGDRELLCVSQFTLYADTRHGNRPGFGATAPAEHAQPLYERFLAAAGARGGRFGARMEVELVNDGPLTVLLES